MKPTLDAYVVMDWASQSGRGGVIVYDDTPAPESAQVVFYTFNYLALTSASARRNLLQNTAEFLLASEGLSTGSISGRVTLYGEPDHSGVVVSTTGATDTTDAGGYYTLAGLYAATYDVHAEKDDFETGLTAGVVVEEGGSPHRVA